MRLCAGSLQRRSGEPSGDSDELVSVKVDGGGSSKKVLINKALTPELQVCFINKAIYDTCVHTFMIRAYIHLYTCLHT